MGLPTGEVQTSFVARYRGDSVLQGLLGNPVNPPGAIFDAGGVPTNQAFPYIVVYPITTRQGRAFAMGTDAKDVTMYVQCFTQAGGGKTARAIMDQVHALTHEYSFTLANGFTNYGTLFENETEVQSPDGLTQQITHRYGVWTQG